MRRHVPVALRRATRLNLGDAIREARNQAGLTQEHLGRRVGLKGRAIYRWERNETSPTGRHKVALIREILAVNAQAATKLQAAFTTQTAKAHGVDSHHAAPAAQPPEHNQGVAVLSVVQDVSGSLELAVLKMADELDVAPRKLRAALATLSQRMHDANATLDAMRRELEPLGV